jgi:AmiR/NasT family two-component response regulator
MFIALESGISMTVQEERIATLEAELDQLKAAVQDSKIVEQATGAISVRYRMSPNDAFEMLCDGARAQRRNLHELASQVTANGGSFAGA